MKALHAFCIAFPVDRTLDSHHDHRTLAAALFKTSPTQMPISNLLSRDRT